MFSKKNKFNCVLCGHDREKFKKKISFCRNCRKIKDYINEYGLVSVLDKIKQPTKATAPPQYPCMD